MSTKPKPTVSSKSRPVAEAENEQEDEEDNPYTITEQDLIKKLKKKNRGRYITQLLVVCIVSLGSLIFGMTLGWANPKFKHTALHSIKTNRSKLEFGYFVSSMPCGYSIGIIPWSYAVTKIGPKNSLILSAPYFFLSFLLINLTEKKEDAFQFLGGFFSIATIIAGEYLIIDSVHHNNLKHMMVIFHAAIRLGYLMSFLIDHFCSPSELNTAIFVIVIIYILFLCYIPESPVYLYHYSEVKAVEALKWIRGESNIHEALRYIKKDAEIRRAGTASYHYMLTKRVVIRAFLIVLGLGCFKVYSGFYIFVFYNYLFWNQYPDQTNKFIKSAIYSSFLFVFNVLGNNVHFRLIYGVRKPLIISTSLIAASLTILTVFMYIDEYTSLNNESWNWVMSFAITFFVISYEIGLGTYAELLLHLYLPYQIYPILKTVFLVTYWFQVFLFSRYFLVIGSKISFFFIFLILTGLAYVSIFYCYHFIVEIKNKNFLQIQLEIGGNPIGNRGAYRHRVSV